VVYCATNAVEKEQRDWRPNATTAGEDSKRLRIADTNDEDFSADIHGEGVSRDDAQSNRQHHPHHAHDVHMP